LKKDFKNALNYYNQVLDVDFNKQEAHESVERIKDAIDNYIYFESKASQVFTSGTLQLKKDRLAYVSSKGEAVYYLDKITKLSAILTSIQFEYPKKFSGVSFALDFKKNKQWVDIINSAKGGIYPGVEF